MSNAKHLVLEPKDKKPTRDGYGMGVVELGKKDTNVVVLTADLSESTRSHFFEAAFPQRFFQVGVAEQNLIGVAAGLALSGKVPFIASYAVFSPGRNWDQLRVSVCYSKANVKVVGGHAGLLVGPDGATHQALEDTAITRCLPNLTIVYPCDYEEARKATIALGKLEGPAYLRTAREATPMMTTTETPFKIGRAEIFREGTDVTIVASGPVVYQALLAAEALSTQGISAEVVNNHTIKPIDAETLVASAKKTGAVVTVEDHQVMGGMGSAVAEVLAQHHPVPIELHGVKDQFGESGTAEQLWKKHGLTKDGIIAAVKKVLARKP